jgi:hypothetical protein
VVLGQEQRDRPATAAVVVVVAATNGRHRQRQQHGCSATYYEDLAKHSLSYLR